MSLAYSSHSSKNHTHTFIHRLSHYVANIVFSEHAQYAYMTKKQNLTKNF